jgi:PTH1 family peptidyl-tRNA hydrolase
VFFKRSERFDYIIVGLGNPGAEYADTRHNVGFKAADAFVEKCQVARKSRRAHAVTISATIGGRRVLIAKPQTYMNLSGVSVRLLRRISPKAAILVVHDDTSLALGKLRLKFGGRAGGHHGIESIIERLGTMDFWRMKLGIGGKEHDDLTDHVLSAFDANEAPVAEKMIAAAAAKIAEFVVDGPEKAMTTGFGAR